MHISEKYKEKIFTWSFIILYGLYIVTFIGLVTFNLNYIRLLRSLIEVITCILLIIRFNPYVYHITTSFDKLMIFTVATFLLFNVAISELYLYDK
jgi:hypothetical protein